MTCRILKSEPRIRYLVVTLSLSRKTWESTVNNKGDFPF
jgi:hypothetical protein